MEETGVLLESFYEKAKQYADTNIELAKLKAIDKSSEIISTLLPRLIVLFFIIMFVFTANIALSLWLGELMGKASYGFLTVSGFYIVVALMVHFFLQKRLKKQFAGAIIARLLN